MKLGFLGFVSLERCALLKTASGFSIGAPDKKVLSLFQHAHADPHRLFNFLKLTGLESCRRERVARVTPIAILFGTVHLPEYAAAIGTVVGHLISQLVDSFDIAQDALGDFRFPNQLLPKLFL